MLAQGSASLSRSPPTTHGAARRRLGLRKLERGVQRPLVRHRGDGKRDDLLLVAGSERDQAYRTALTITGLVTAIATYHYFRIFNSWNDAFEVKYSADAGDYVVKLSGAPFNDAYRYVDWVLTVPLLLIELILVMGLPAKETVSKSWTLGLASAIMVALGYPGEIQSDPTARWKFWFLAMIPFLYVVAELAVGLQNAAGKMTASVASLTAYARWLTIISWLTYPFVYIIKMLGISGVSATAGEQIGYSIADVVAKAVFGILIWAIAAEKTKI